MMNDRRTHLDAPAVALLVLCCALWGLGQVATKLTLAEVPPFLQAGIRSLGATVLLLLWMRWRGIAIVVRDGTLGPGLLAGALFALEFAALFAGLQYTSAARAVVFLYTAPFVVALGMPFISAQERLAPAQWAGLLLAFLGVVWAFSEGFVGGAGAQAHRAHQPNQALGDALVFTAAVVWGATTLVMRGSGLARIAPERTLLYQLVVSAVALLVASPMVGEAWPQRWTAASLVPLTFQTVVITFFTYLSWFWLVRHYPATKVSAFTLLAPLFGVAAGAAILGDVLSARLLTAAIAVCAGIALLNLAGRKASAKT